MINSNNITKRQAKKILNLIEQMTRAEILARLGKFDNLEFADYAMHKIEIEKELLEYIFETSSLVKLGKRWKILNRSGKVRHGKSKKGKKTTA